MPQRLHKDDSELNDIAQLCLDKISKAQGILDKVTQPPSRTQDKLKNPWRAVQSSLSGDVKDLESDLQILRKDLDTRILVSLRSRHDLALVQ